MLFVTWRSSFRLLAFFIIFAFNKLNAQTSNGIIFEKLENWNAVITKAQREKKFIFVDAYTTWCVPCKMMNQHVFTDKDLGDVLNNKFISVQIQMDVTNGNDEFNKSWIRDIARLQELADINAYPTILFFTSDGKLVLKSQGFKDAGNLIRLADFASKPEEKEKFEKDLFAYQKGKLEVERFGDLANNVKQLLGDYQLGINISKEYKTQYLDKLPREKALTKENIQFIEKNGGSNLLNIGDRFFKFAYSYPALFDSLAEKKVAEKFVIAIIKKFEITDKIKSNDEQNIKPQWPQIEKTIKTKYPRVDIEKIILLAKQDYFTTTADWDNYTRYRSEYLSKYPLINTDGLTVALQLNEPAWNIFLHTDNTNALKRAVEWSRLSIKMLLPDTNPEFYDTQANLLYKLGKVSEAIKLQQIAFDLLFRADPDKKSVLQSGIAMNLYKMQRGITTWK
jgi:thioredoxin-related protein